MQILQYLSSQCGKAVRRSPTAGSPQVRWNITCGKLSWSKEPSESPNSLYYGIKLLWLSYNSTDMVLFNVRRKSDTGGWG
jgi:hypothetical protein